jgi:hypothetical protein
MYLLLTLSAFETNAIQLQGLVINFYWMHTAVLLLGLVLTSNKVKKGFGYEGI